MDLYRFRIEVPDDAGRIGRALVALGRLDVNVVEIDCHNVDGAVRVDDLLVDVAGGLDHDAVRDALDDVGCPLVEIRPMPAHDLEDPVTRSMRLLACVVTAETLSADLIAWCAGELVRSDLACVLDARIVRPGTAAGRAMAGGVAVHGRQWVKRLPTAGVQPWVLAVPFERAGAPTVLEVYRTSSRFTRTETARLRTLLDAASRRSLADAHPVDVPVGVRNR